MNYKRKKIGVTLVETLIGVSLVGTASAGFISHNIEDSKKVKAETFLNEAKSIIHAFDHRISIDGYDSTLWNDKEWNNRTEIVNKLIRQELTSVDSSTCNNGSWNPSLNTESDTKLIACDLWLQSTAPSNYNLSANFEEDSVGFIQKFDLNISFKSDDIFKDEFKYIKAAMNRTKIDTVKEMSGSHYFDFYSSNSNDILSASECILEESDCFIKMSFERSGGAEYLLADGSNSMIGEHLTFIETKGDAPMKCIRWKNTNTDGTGAWSPTPAEDCGIGIYRDLNHPAVVDVVGETGTFEHVLLDQDCNLFQVNSVNGLVETNGTSPCGMLNGTEAIQVVDNIHATTIVADTGTFNVLNTDKLVANEITTKTLTVSGLTTLKELEVTGDVAISGSITSVTNVIGTGTFKAPIGDFDNINADIQDFNSELSSLQSSLNSLNNSINNITSAWVVGGWSGCSSSCGAGTQSRSVSCPTNKICSGSRPSSSQSCTGSGHCWEPNRGDNSGNDGPNR